MTTREFNKMTKPEFNKNQNIWEIDVVRDNSCLFWAVTLACLIPVKDKEHRFQERFKRLFGKKSLDKLEHIKNWIKVYNPFSEDEAIFRDETLKKLIREQFRNRVVNHMRKTENRNRFEPHFDEGGLDAHLDKMKDPDTWGDEHEIRAMSDLLVCCIQVISTGKELNYGVGTPIQLFHVRVQADSPVVNHYYFGLEKSLGDVYQVIINTRRAVEVSQQKQIQSSAEKEALRPREKRTSEVINVAGVSGTRNFMITNKITLIGKKEDVASGTENFMHTNEMKSQETIKIDMASGIRNVVIANTIKLIDKQIIVPHTPPAEHLPEQWQVYPKNPNFTGRKELLKQIEDNFSKESGLVVLTTTHGLGGIGKTQLAIEFIWQHYQQYEGVVWFNAENRNRLLADYVRLGEELNIIREDEKKITVEERALRVKHWLEDPKRAGWLLVYDNAPKYGGRKNDGVGDLFPTKEGKILVTSRYAKGWPQESILVNVFTLEESRAYIQKVLSNKALDISQVDQLAEKLGQLPLALAQACAYIKHTSISCPGYLKRYEARKRELLSDEILTDQTLPPDSHQAIVYITWDITMEAVRKESQLADRWLTTCAYLNSTDIPNFLLEVFAGSSKNNPNAEMVEAALGSLGSYSMLTINEQRNSTSVHHLVQEVIQLQSEVKRDVKHNRITVFCLLKECFPNPGETIADYDRKRQLLPHMEAFIAHLDTWREASLSSLQQEIETNYLREILSLMANGYRNLGDAHKESNLLERALKIDERHYGVNHPAVANMLGNLGNAYGDQGDAHKKRELLERALPILEHQYGPHHYQVAIVLGNLGNAYGSLGDTYKQRELLERSLAINERYYGLDHYQVAIALTNLSNAYGALGNAHKQRDLLELALKINERHYGPDHPEVASTLMNLGTAYGNLGDTRKKRDQLERALTINERHYGLDHYQVASTLTGLGNAYGSLGDAQKERELLERALTIDEGYYGPDHYKVGNTLMNLANAYAALGDVQKQSELLERALPILEHHYGPDEFQVAITLRT